MRPTLLPGTPDWFVSAPRRSPGPRSSRLPADTKRRAQLSGAEALAAPTDGSLLLRAPAVEEHEGRGRDFGRREAVQQRLDEEVVGGHLGGADRFVQVVDTRVEGGRDAGGTGGADALEAQAGGGGDLLEVAGFAHRGEGPCGSAGRVTKGRGGASRGDRAGQRCDGLGLGHGVEGLAGRLVLAGGEPYGDGLIAGGAGAVAVHGKKVPQVRRLVRGRGEDQHVADGVVQQRGGERQRRLPAIPFEHDQVEFAGGLVGRWLFPGGFSRPLARPRRNGGGPVGEALGERAQREAEGKAAEDALAPLWQAGQKGLEVIGGDALDHAVAVVQDQGLNMRDVDGPAVQRLHAVGGDEQEVGAFGEQPILGQSGGTRSGGLAEAREGPRELGGLALPRAENQADRRSLAPFEPVQQGDAVADQGAAAGPRPGPSGRCRAR